MVILVTTHRVADGETLSSIAALHNTTPETIRSLSSLRTEGDHPGPVGLSLLVPRHKE